VLLVSELVQNAVGAGDGEPTVEIQRAGHGLRIGVHDNRPSIPPQRARLVGVETATRASRIVWFEIHTFNG
jgi:hypothetical protein